MPHAARLVVVAAVVATAAGLRISTPAPRPLEAARSSAKTTRKDFCISTAVAIAAATSSSSAARAAGGLVPATQLVDELAQLRADTRAGRMNAKKVTKATAKTLEPLRNAMEKNPFNNSDKAKLQPLLMKGHMLELEEALASPDGFKEYVSKTTQDTYPGGKVERELEEAVETAEAYCSEVNCDTLLVYRQ
mmetsp:Transcript_18596/g.74241  ORF Transcript_18596/g.74241 Transcript_18596/m.74241 type:complete len:191 (-) Transcript_18596:250-822(-)